MGIRDWFKSAPKPAPVSAPSALYATPFDAIAALVREYRAGNQAGWLTFEGACERHSVVVQISGDVINFGTTEVALPSLLGASGLMHLAAGAGPGGHPKDRTLWSVPGASAEELAAIVHEAFVTILGLGEGYSLVGSRDE